MKSMTLEQVLSDLTPEQRERVKTQTDNLLRAVLVDGLETAAIEALDILFEGTTHTRADIQMFRSKDKSPTIGEIKQYLAQYQCKARLIVTWPDNNELVIPL